MDREDHVSIPVSQPTSTAVIEVVENTRSVPPLPPPAKTEASSASTSIMEIAEASPRQSSGVKVVSGNTVTPMSLESPQRLSRTTDDGRNGSKKSVQTASETSRDHGRAIDRLGLSSFGRANLRNMLKETEWYHSKMAMKVRAFLHGKLFAFLIIVALILALFLPDVWVIAGINSNTIIDVALTVVLFLFTMELVLLSTVDANYMLSFFFAMDVVGTFSLAFDMSYLLGESATDPQVSGDNDESRSRFMLLRAARAAKVGARAGRLSRLLRMLRFVPFLASKNVRDHEAGQVGIASMISGQLADLLATRVACLTIILVMVIPLFEVWNFPQQDYSPETWAERIAVQLQRGKFDAVKRELALMVSFFNRQTYGPYKACLGQLSGSIFDCAPSSEQPAVLEAWQPGFSDPPRGRSAFLVMAGEDSRFAVSFNMHRPAVLEAGLTMATIFFIIFIMVFSGLALSSVVNELAVRPLERMLSTVRTIATTVFKFTSEVEEEVSENADINGSNEIKLLEKVVEKLALIADLQTRKTIATTDDMRDEDIGIISMMQGNKESPQGGPTTPSSKKSVVARTTVTRKQNMGKQVRMEDFGLSQESYNSWSFNPFLLSKAQRCSLVVYAVAGFSESGEGFINSVEDEALLQRFVAACDKQYMANPYHNFGHAVDTVHGVAKLMRLMNIEVFLSELDQFSVLISAVAHDLGHPGVNNAFLSEVGHDLALQYNDRSPLENMHCAKLYTIVALTETNVFQKLTKEQYKEARKLCIEMILHTDMVGHQAMIKDLQMAYQMHTEVFEVPPDPEGNNRAELEVFTDANMKMLAMDCILHAADVSNSCRAWETTVIWADKIVEEFFAQGDQEKMLGIPVQFLNDRDKLNKPNSQIGFIEFMIAPFFAAQIRLWPKVGAYGDNLANNIELWEEMWSEEVSPSEEEKTKVHGRVMKVRQVIEDAKARA